MVSTDRSSGASRRQFLKSFAYVMAGSFGAPLILGGLGEATAYASTTTTGVFTLPLAGFPALQNDNGSLLIQVPGVGASFPKIVVTRLPDNQFAAVTSKCTHQGCTVNAFSESLGRIRCSCHGSEYQATGEVVRGPAQAALTRYPAEYDGVGAVAIQIPGLGYSVTIATVANSPRLALGFPSATGLTYRIETRGTEANGVWGAVPFSLTADGALDQTSLVGTGSPLQVYVARPGEAALFRVAGA